jgi:hypothetical protein
MQDPVRRRRDHRRAARLGIAALLATLVVLPTCSDTASAEVTTVQGDRHPGAGANLPVAASAGSIDRPPMHERIDEPSLAVCGGCHADVYDEWAQSLHHGAWTNENVRTATDDFRRAACRACHSPMPVLEQESLGDRPAYRHFNQNDGVHCLSCHGLSDGVAAARTIPDAPCRPIYSQRLLQAESCEPCHEPTHHAFEEYRRSDAAALGVRCVDCHMQPVDRDGRPGRSHGPHGGMNAEFVARALAWQARVEGDEVVVELRNRCGHKFPGEIPSRSLVLSVRFDDRDPEHLQLRKPFKGEDRQDDRLQPDETRTLRFAFPEGTNTAHVAVRFHPLPLTPAERAHDLGRWSGSR